jgi:hypothetical protein
MMYPLADGVLYPQDLDSLPELDANGRGEQYYFLSKAAYMQMESAYKHVFSSLLQRNSIIPFQRIILVADAMRDFSNQAEIPEMDLWPLVDRSIRIQCAELTAEDWTLQEQRGFEEEYALEIPIALLSVYIPGCAVAPILLGTDIAGPAKFLKSQSDPVIFLGSILRPANPAGSEDRPSEIKVSRSYELFTAICHASDDPKERAEKILETPEKNREFVHSLGAYAYFIKDRGN